MPAALVLAPRAGRCVAAAPAGAYQHLSQHAAVSGVQPDHWQTLPIDLTVDNGPTDILGRDHHRDRHLERRPDRARPVGHAATSVGPVDFDEHNLGTAWGDLTGDGQPGGRLRRGRHGAHGARLRPGLGQRLRARATRSSAAARRVIDDMFLIINGRARTSTARRPRSTSSATRSASRTPASASRSARTARCRRSSRARCRPCTRSRSAGTEPPHARGRRRRGAVGAVSRAARSRHRRHDHRHGDPLRTGDLPVLGANVRAINVARPVDPAHARHRLRRQDRRQLHDQRRPARRLLRGRRAAGRRRRIPRPARDVHARRHRLHAGVLQRVQGGRLRAGHRPGRARGASTSARAGRRPPT